MLSVSIAAPAMAQAPSNPFILAAAKHAAPTAATEGEAENVTRVNSWTVGIAGGPIDGTFIRFAAELAKALDDGEQLRILPTVTYGAAENVADLLYLKGIDVAITHADVFAEFKKEHKYSNIEKRINYISEMYISEYHFYVRPEIKSLKDLDGKKVGLNVKGSSANMADKMIFERLGIKIEPVFVHHSQAIEQMKTGELAGLVHVVGKPVELFKKEPKDQGFHFLPLEYSDKFADYYLPTTLTSDDYPNLIKPGEKIDTIGVPVVLAVYNWPKGSDRLRRVERFIQYYFARFDTLKKPPYHPKWKEINLSAKVPGWNRFWVAEEAYARWNSTPPDAQASSATLSAPAKDPQSENLYQEFLAWKKSRGN
jgi:TRAP-type uncharacterized transport system substrate-binding protein